MPTTFYDATQSLVEHVLIYNLKGELLSKLTEHDFVVKDIIDTKKGRIYRLKLDTDGTAILGDVTQHFYTQNRYRDIVVNPDGKSFYMITDVSGKTADASGMNVVTNMQNPGAILKFTYDK